MEDERKVEEVGGATTAKRLVALGSTCTPRLGFQIVDFVSLET